jgi:hypothetical protein
MCIGALGPDKLKPFGLEEEAGFGAEGGLVVGGGVVVGEEFFEFFDFSGFSAFKSFEAAVLEEGGLVDRDFLIYHFLPFFFEAFFVEG